jgi:chemotaxis signal transduction protein
VIKHVSLLLFSVQNMSFGVCTEQVEELFEDRILKEREERNTEYTILYKGQDIRVIDFSTWLEKEQGTRNGESFELQGANFVPEAREYDDFYIPSPKILIIKRQDEGYIGVRINNLEDLAIVSIKCIHSLPVIMQNTKRIQGLWGIALVKSRPVILIDLTQL